MQLGVRPHPWPTRHVQRYGPARSAARLNEMAPRHLCGLEHRAILEVDAISPLSNLSEDPHCSMDIAAINVVLSVAGSALAAHLLVATETLSMQRSTASHEDS